LSPSGIENPGIHRQQQLMQPIDVGADLGMPGRMMQPCRTASTSKGR
jgi:hypothetical protein